MSHYQSALLRALLTSAATILVATPSSAQDTQASQDEVSDAVDQDLAVAIPDDASLAQDEPAIVVTGSRLPSLDYDTPTPVISIGEDLLANQGTTNLTEFLLNEPALVGSQGDLENTNSFIGSTGLNLLNLRNLGIARTLVLVNGRRHITQLPNNAAVDINTIPVDLIERIDVVTGGTSAVYGADAVSGVVNFITKTDFEGVAARAQYGRATAGEPTDYFGSLTAGLNFGGGRGNVAGSFQYSHSGRLRSADRDYAGPYASRRAFYRNGEDEANGDDPNVPDNILYEDVRFCDTAPNGGVFTSFSNEFVAPDFTGDGQPFSVGNATIPPYYCSGGSGTRTSGYTGDLIGKSDSYVGNILFSYELGGGHKLFAEGKFARVDAIAEGQPSFDFFLGAFPDNPFMPQTIRDDLIYGLAFVSRDNFDLGKRLEETSRDTYRGVLALRGDVSDAISYDVSYVYGRTEVENLSRNNRLNDRWYAAIDVVTNPATGQPDCRYNVDPSIIPDEANYNDDVLAAYENGTITFSPGECEPFNLFEDGGAINAAAADWIMQDTLASSYSEHHVLSGYLYGKLGFLGLQGGDIGWVLGTEYRKEKAQDTPNEYDARGLTFGNKLAAEGGKFDVWEVYGELEFPFLADVAGAHELTVNLAGRYSDYSTIGKTWTYNVGVVWAPIRDIRLRGTYARAVRAPNLGELFGAQSQNFALINDPCDIANVGDGTQYREANCAAVLGAIGVDPATFIDPNSASVAGLTGGNPDLSEESSDVYTAGVVFRPGFLPGLNLAFDYYDIKIGQAINFPTAQAIAENCYDAPDLDNVFCDNIARNADPSSSTYGGINFFSTIPQNVANFKTRGVDMNLNWAIRPVDYGFSSSIGSFNVRLVGSYLDHLSFIPTPGADVNDDRNEVDAPKWLATFDLTWLKGPLTVNYGYNFYSKTLRGSNAETEADPDLFAPEYLWIKPRSTHDLQVNYAISDAIDVYAGGTNIFNQKPDIGLTQTPVSPVGRFLYGGLRVRL